MRVPDPWPQLHTSASRGGVGRFDSVRNQLRLVFSDRRQDVKGELVGLRKVDRDEFDSRLHEATDHVNVSGESIEVSNDQDSTEESAVI